MCVTQNRQAVTEEADRFGMRKIEQSLAFVHIRRVQDESKRRVSHSVTPCIAWIETTGRADLKLTIEKIG